jgi:hypothetical protein
MHGSLSSRRIAHLADRSRSETLRANEQIKGIAGVLSNLGTALFASGFGRWFLNGADLYVSLWIVSGAGIIWVGVRALTLLEAEIDDG